MLNFRDKMFMKGTALLLVSLLASCSTTFTLGPPQERVARIQVNSTPPGAKIYVNNAEKGETPRALEIPYTEMTKSITYEDRKQGWLYLISGLLGLVGGGAMTGIGFANYDTGGIDSGDSTAALETTGYLYLAAFGIVIAMYGLFGVGYGGYKMAVGRGTVETTATEPPYLNFALKYPGKPTKVAQLTPKSDGMDMADLFKINQVNYDAEEGRWRIPNLPETVNLTLSRPAARPPAARRVFRRVAAAPAAPRPRKRVIVAVFDIEDRGADISAGMLGRLSDYLAMKLAATGAFQVVPRDQLKKRLVEQKKESFKQCYDQSCQIEVGKEMAAQKSLSTMVAKLGSRCVVTAVLYDLRKAASEGGASAKGGCSEDGIVETLEKVVEQLAP